MPSKSNRLWSQEDSSALWLYIVFSPLSPAIVAGLILLALWMLGHC